MDRWDRAREARAEAAGQASQRRHLELRQEEATAHQQAAWGRINHLARLEARLQELRDLSGLGPAAPADAGPGAIELPGGPAADLGWEGPHGPRITGRWATVILGCLVLVEVPIQYIIFQYFHGYSPLEEVLTWVFTIPTSAVMVLLPHLAGWWYRSRTATGSDRLLRVIPLLLLAPWAFLAVVLGYLRARVLLAPITPPPATGDTSYLKGVKFTSNAAALHVTPTTMVVLFSALILGVGGIGFLLGLAREHPFAGAFSGAAAQRAALEGQLDGMAPRIELAGQQAAGTGVPVAELAELWRQAARSGADGITVSGGEPLAQPDALACMLAAVDAIRAELGQQDDAAGRPRRVLDILVYTGYEPAEFTPEQGRAVAAADVLITGRFDITAPTGLIWRGSANQQMVLRTPLGHERYADMVGHVPARAPMQASVTDDGIWLIGVPRSGGVRALERGLRQRGVRLGSPTWRGAGQNGHQARPRPPSRTQWWSGRGPKAR